MMREIGLIGALLLTLCFRGVDSVCYVPDPARSRIWIEGRSTVNRFTCTATQMEGIGKVHREQVILAWFAVPVRAFDCGRQAMNRDLQRALQADRFPEICFELGEVAVLEQPTDDSIRLEVTGMLTLSGTTRPVRFVAAGWRLEAGHVRLVGGFPLSLTAFNVKPPAALLGLIRVYDEVMVHFDLVVHPAARWSCAATTLDSLNQPDRRNQPCVNR